MEILLSHKQISVSSSNYIYSITAFKYTFKIFKLALSISIFWHFKLSLHISKASNLYGRDLQVLSDTIIGMEEDEGYVGERCENKHDILMFSSQF